MGFLAVSRSRLQALYPADEDVDLFFGRVFVVTSTSAIVADAVGGVVALGHFVGFAADEFFQG